MGRIFNVNITEKLLAKAGGKPSVAPGDIVFANVDKVMIHDVSGPGVIKVFDKLKKEGNRVKIFIQSDSEKEILDGLQKGLEKVGLIVERQAKINVSQSPPSHPQYVQAGLQSHLSFISLYSFNTLLYFSSSVNI